MLESLRKWAAGYLATVLIGLLILSFAIWGVEDSIRGIIGGNYLAKVGSQEISEREYQRAFQQELDDISRQAGRRISLAQARAVGLDRQVLDRLTAMSAIESHANELGLGLSQQTLADELKKESMFHGLDGKFSRERLDGILRQHGLSEAGLLELRRRDKLRAEILKAFEGSVVVPKPVIDVLYAHRNEKRVVQYATIDTAKVLKLKDPTDEDLKKSYEDNKVRYMSEETRALNILILSIDALKTKVKVPDEAVKEAYEQTSEDYDKPEKRRLYQIAFPTVEAAKEAREKIEKGEKFIDVGKKAGALETDMDLGMIQRASLIDSKIADAAFSLKKDEVSQVIEGQFATVLLQVTEIEEGENSTFDQVKGDVRAKLAGEMALQRVATAYSEVDDGLAAGKSLNEISEGLDIPYIEIGAVDRNNKSSDGSAALTIKEAQKIVDAGFEAEVGIEQEPIQLEDGGFAWVQLTETTPAKQKTFEEVSDEVKTFWTDNERSRELSSAAAKLVERLKGGESFAAIATEIGGSVETSEPVTRAKIPDGLTESAMSQVFILPKGGASSSETRDGLSRTIFQVTEITPAAAPSDADIKPLENELSGVLQREQSEQYVDGLERRYSVDINEPLFERITGVIAQ